jgi:hypothetical protein
LKKADKGAGWSMAQDIGHFRMALSVKQLYFYSGDKEVYMPNHKNMQIVFAKLSNKYRLWD